MTQEVQLAHSDHVPSGKTFPLSLLAQDVTDPANVGGLFRLADALGVRHLYLTGTSVTPHHAKVRRAARATHNHVSWSYAEDALGLIRDLQRREVWVVSLEITNQSEDVRLVRPPLQRDVLLVVGGENSGVSSDLLSLSAQSVHLPMLGQNSSMNLVVAAALAVFELTRYLVWCNR